MKRWFRFLTVTAITTACLVAIGLVVMHSGRENAVEAYKRKLVARGEKLSIEENIPQPIPADQNAAGIVRQVFGISIIRNSVIETNPPRAMRMVAPGRAMIGWKQPEIRDSDATNTWEDVSLALGWREQEIELLRQVIEKPALDFKLDYNKGAYMLLSHLAPLKRVSMLLSSAAVFELHESNTEAAITNLRASLAVVHGFQSERALISQLVRIAMIAITQTATWELFQSQDLKDEQLKMLQTDWESVQFIEPMEGALLMDRAVSQQTIQKVRASPSEYINSFTFVYGGGPSPTVTSGSGNWFDQAEDFVKENWHGAKSKGKEFVWRVAWSYPDELRSLQGFQALLDAIRFARTNGCFQPEYDIQKKLIDALDADARSGHAWMNDLADLDGTDLRVLLFQSVGSLDKALIRVLKAEATRRMTVVAIALKRYELKNRHYPETLSELTPDFLTEIPVDPVDGKPMRYKSNPDGTFLLYSIGEDNKDDGGDPSAPKSTTRYYWQSGRDYVWPMPANENEIRFYEATRPR